MSLMGKREPVMDDGRDPASDQASGGGAMSRLFGRKQSKVETEAPAGPRASHPLRAAVGGQAEAEPQSAAPKPAPQPAAQPKPRAAQPQANTQSTARRFPARLQDKGFGPRVTANGLGKAPGSDPKMTAPAAPAPKSRSAAGPAPGAPAGQGAGIAVGPGGGAPAGESQSRALARPNEIGAVAGGAERDDPLLECLVILSALFERPHSADSLTAGLPIVKGKLTPALFLRAAERAGLSARIIKRPIPRITPLSLPCVLLLDNDNACVLVKVDSDGVLVVVPETGRGVTRISMEEIEARYVGHAIFAKPEYQFDSRSDATRLVRPRSWFWGTLAKFWRIYTQVLIASVFINLFAIASPLFIMNVYDRVVPINAVTTLWVLAIGVVTAFLFEFVLKFLRGYFVDTAGKSADVILASHIFEQIMGIRLEARPASAGAFANQLREFETLRDFFTSATMVAVVDLPFIFLFLAVIYFIGGPIVFVPLLAVPLVIIVGFILQKPMAKTVRATQKESAQKHALLVESIFGLETVKALGAEGRTQRDWERFVGMTSKSSMKARMLSQFAMNFTALVTQLTTVGVVFTGVMLMFLEGNPYGISVGALVACTILTGRAMAPLAQIASIMTRFDQSMVSLDTLDKIMSMPVERPAGKSFLHRPRLNGEIEFRDVTFRYPNQEVTALDRVSFHIKPGERVGVIGKIGSGKSTIEKLVLNLYGASEGSVLIDGTDIGQVDPADLRRSIGYVPQDIFLFYGSVRDNIAMGMPHADDADILRAARIAGVDNFVSKHPHGFDLQVGERGESLSGGQRQSIAIARALVRNPKILVLDEPTSAMDKGSEDWFLSRLREEIDQRTLIVVTQRVSLLAVVDRLIVMDSGKVVADGPRDKVLETLARGQIRGTEM